MSCCEPYFIFHEICSRILIIVNKVMLHDDICTRMLHSDIFSFIEKNILQIRPGQCPNIKKKMSFLYRKKYTKIKPQQQMCIFFLFINTNSRSFFWPWPNIWGLDLLFPVLTIKVFHRDMFYSSRIQTVWSDAVSIWIRPKKKK